MTDLPGAADEFFSGVATRSFSGTLVFTVDPGTDTFPLATAIAVGSTIRLTLGQTQLHVVAILFNGVGAHP